MFVTIATVIVKVCVCNYSNSNSESICSHKCGHLYFACSSQAIIFCRTKLDCDNVEQYLLKLGGGEISHLYIRTSSSTCRGSQFPEVFLFVLGKGMVNKYSCVCLHGDRRPQERKANLQAFKDGDVRFLICTDVAARGIDVQGIPFGKP